MAPPAAPEVPGPSPLEPARLLTECPVLATASALWVAFSGGLDSTVLLHLVAALRAQGGLAAPVRALHVNHGLQAAAAGWQDHCERFAAALGVGFEGKTVAVRAAAGLSPEDAARQARYEAFAAVLGKGEVLLLAHHRDDQVETVLFRTLRGSGPAGLAGMPATRPCGEGLLLRPLLGRSRAELEAHARRHALAWIEDGSNTDPRFDRNFLRGTILPALLTRWPGLAAAVTKTAELAGEAASLLDELAAEDLRAARGPAANQLRVDGLLALRDERRRNLLRHWLHEFHRARGVALPTYELLQAVTPHLLMAAADAQPVLEWGQGSAAAALHRFRGMVYLLPRLPQVPPVIRWDPCTALALPAPLGVLELEGEPPAGMSFEVRFRAGGEHLRPPGRPTRALKKLLQELRVPPWLRGRLPLLYADGRLVAVADLCVAAEWAETTAEKSCRVVWRRSDLDCGC